MSILEYALDVNKDVSLIIDLLEIFKRLWYNIQKGECLWKNILLLLI